MVNLDSNVDTVPGSKVSENMHSIFVNSTYDDSMQVNVHLKGQINITIIKDHKDNAGAGMKPTKTEIDKIEQMTNDLVNDKTKNSKDAIERAQDIIERLKNVGNSDDDNSNRVKQLMSIVILFRHNLMLEMENETKLLRLVTTFKREINTRKFKLTALQELKNVSNEIQTLMKTVKSRKIQTTARNALKFYEYSLNDATVGEVRNAVSMIKNMENKIRVFNYSLEDPTTLNAQYSETLQLLEVLNGTQHYQKAIELRESILNITNHMKTIKILDSNYKNMTYIEHQQAIEKLKNIAETTKNFEVKNLAEQLLSKIHHENADKKVKKYLANLSEKLAVRGALKVIALHRVAYKMHFYKKLNDSIGKEATIILNRINEIVEESSKASAILDKIEHKLKAPSNKDELNQLEAHREKLTDVANSIYDLSIAENAKSLIEAIDKLVMEFKVGREIDNITSELNRLNQSLESNESDNSIKMEIKHLSELENSAVEIDKNVATQEKHDNIKVIMNNISSMKRRLPFKTAKIAQRNEAKILIKIINGFLEGCLPTMRDQIVNATEDFGELLENDVERFDVSGLKRRLNIVRSEQNYVKGQFESIRNKLMNFQFTAIEQNQTMIFNSTTDARLKVESLKNLLNYKRTARLVRKAIKIIQDLEHADETLKQAFKMLDFLRKFINCPKSNKLVIETNTSNDTSPYAQQSEQINSSSMKPTVIFYVPESVTVPPTIENSTESNNETEISTHQTQSTVIDNTTAYSTTTVSSSSHDASYAQPLSNQSKEDDGKIRSIRAIDPDRMTQNESSINRTAISVSSVVPLSRDTVPNGNDQSQSTECSELEKHLNDFRKTNALNDNMSKDKLTANQ